MEIAVLGIDLGKNSCSVVGLDGSGRVVLRRRMHRDAVVKLASGLPACIMAMEACCGSVPERYVGKSVTVTKMPATIEVRHKAIAIAVHRRVIGQRDTRSVQPGHHGIPVRQVRGTAAEERCCAVKALAETAALLVLTK